MTLSRRHLATALGAAACAAQLATATAFICDRVVLDRVPATGAYQLQYLGLSLSYTLLVAAGVTIVRHRPENRIGWVLLVGSAAACFGAAANGYVWFGQLADREGTVYAEAVELPGRAYAGWMYGWLSSIWAGISLPLLFLLYPNGRLPGRRWRAVAAFVVAAGGALVVARLGAPAPVQSSVRTTPNPFGQSWLAILAYRVRIFDDEVPVVSLVSWVGIAVAALAPLGRLGLRRRAPAREVPLRVFAVCALVIGAWVALGVFRFVSGRERGTSTIETSVVVVAFVGLGATLIDAVFRHHLAEIEVALRRTAVFGGLSIFIAIVYVGSTFAIGSAAAGVGAAWAVPLSATGIAAVGLQPVRQRAEALATRLVFGTRPAPAQLLGDLAGRLAGTSSLRDALPLLAESLRSAFGASTVSVEVRPEGSAVSTATRPDRGASDSIHVDISFGGEPAGRLHLERTVREPWTAAERHLLDLVAAQLAPAFNTARVDTERLMRAEEAEHRAASLRASRRRIASAQLVARTRFAEDVHGRVFPLLDAVADALLFDDAAGARDAAERALGEVRRIGHGLDPSELRDLGPVAALAAEARDRGVALDLAVHGGPPERWEESIERALFLALVATVRASDKERVTITITLEGNRIKFAAEGFGPLRDYTAADVEDRIAAAGGDVTLDAYRLEGWLPVDRRSAQVTASGEPGQNTGTPIS